MRSEQLSQFESLAAQFSLIRNRGKIPVEKDWQSYCHKRREFTEIGFQPGDNAGIACGPASDVLVLDIDDIDLFDAAYKKYGWTIPQTRMHQTGSGKPHVLFRYPNDGRVYGNKACGKKYGFDIRGDGGQVVAPGSIHPNTGKSYTVLQDLPLAAAPEWLLKLYDEEQAEVKNETVTNNRFFKWDGEIERLPIKAETKQLILQGVAVGERSEAIMAVCNALVWSNLTDDQIIDVFEKYPIGSKYRRKGTGREKWLRAHIGKARARVTDRAKAPVVKTDNEKDQLTDWTRATELFPSVMFPWEVFPHRVANSLNQLARACASSAASLPGAAFCLLASALGRSVAVSPKGGWSEPLIFWHTDIRPSGAGKTPAARELANVLHLAQAMEEARWKAEADEWRRLSKREQSQRDQPKRPRGYFATDLTLEGLRDDLAGHPSGGIVVIQDELSGFITAQNQYKSKGNDREAWLSLWDGKPARVVRKERSVYLSGGRVSIFGGIQPGVFQRVFSKDEDGLYLVDGTIFRFLMTCEGHSYHELTVEAWQEDNRQVWELILQRALYWAGGQIEKEPSVRRQILNTEAQTAFLDWRNEREGLLAELPEQFRGFLPKAYSYALRLAGVLHCLHRFDGGDEPDTILNLTDIQRGICAVEFYLGQTVGALQVLEDSSHQPDALDERALHLAMVLDSLRGHVDSGRLAVGYVHDWFNKGLPEHQKFKNSKAMGAFLRSVGLTISNSLHDANGKSRARCLVWDEKMNFFLTSSLERLGSLESVVQQEFAERDVENAMSRKSWSNPDDDDRSETSETSKSQRLGSESLTRTHSGDFRDIRDVVSGNEEESRLDFNPDWMKEEIFI